MANVFNPNVCRVVMEGRLYGQVYQNVFHVAVGLPGGAPGPWTLPMLEELAQKVESFSADLAAFQTANLLYTSVTVRQMVQDAPLVYVAALEAGGINEGDAMPNSVALVFTLRSAVGGRSGSGRMYIGGIPENAVTGNNVSPEWANGVQAAIATGLRNRLSETGSFDMRLVVYSTETGGLPRPVGLAREVTSVQVLDRSVDSQRRRLPGRGR